MLSIIAAILLFSSVAIVFAKGITGWEIGYQDGRDRPFSQKKLDEIGFDYFHGYIAGCMSVKGNTLDACNDATDHNGD
jgi:hypothetical protein